MKFSSLKDSLKAIASAHGDRICLWLSGGADSLFLLETLVSLNLPFGVLRFDDGWTRRQKKRFEELTGKHNLQVFSYPAIEHFLIADDENISLASRYSVGEKGETKFLVRDLVAPSPEGEKPRCAFEIKLETAAPGPAPILFEAHIRGSRFDDRHWSVKKVLPEENTRLGEVCFYAPLATWTREEVIEGLKFFGIDYQEPDEVLDTGNIECCSACLMEEKPFCPKQQKEIEPVKWDRKLNLEHFRSSLK